MMVALIREHLFLFQSIHSHLAFKIWVCLGHSEMSFLWGEFTSGLRDVQPLGVLLTVVRFPVTVGPLYLWVPCLLSQSIVDQKYL